MMSSAALWDEKRQRRTAAGAPRAFDFTPVEHFDIAAVKPGMIS
jgi:hypothetical protein